MVEALTNGNGASLCNISEALDYLVSFVGWTKDVTVIQNGGHASRLAELAAGNKGAVALFDDVTLYDLACWEAGLFSPHVSDCVQIAPIDMFQIPANARLLEQVARNLERGHLVVVGIPVRPDELTPKQLEKWGFLVTRADDDEVVGFVEHPGTAANLIAGLPAGDASEFNLYFSTFRFFLKASTLANIASAIRPELARLPAGHKIDLSDHVIEPLFRSESSEWRAKQGALLASSGATIAERLVALGVGVSVASAGADGVSEDLGTHEALEAFRQFREVGPASWGGVWTAIHQTMLSGVEK
ncbi:hypothetical protein J2847_006762 [Azospirillum agricola]|uniref:hypothetical protein n=1 Tax=Azospirillum agricola TaxID=1720247 RepID=UPI001AE2381D|nr:hypothetical protein [Azospirillum agricola]MBP2233424.1 hypothetical protein [Azospirillum agricola]